MHAALCSLLPLPCLPCLQQHSCQGEASGTAPTLVDLQALTGIGPPTNSMLSMEGFQSMEGSYGRFIDR